MMKKRSSFADQLTTHNSTRMGVYRIYVDTTAQSGPRASGGPRGAGAAGAVGRRRRLRRPRPVRAHVLLQLKEGRMDVLPD